MYPACAIDEYASSRLMLDCVSAASVPSVIDSTATAAKIATQSMRTGQKTVIKSRSSSANAAAFDATLT